MSNISPFDPDRSLFKLIPGHLIWYGLLTRIDGHGRAYRVLVARTGFCRRKEHSQSAKDHFDSDWIDHLLLERSASWDTIVQFYREDNMRDSNYLSCFKAFPSDSSFGR